MQARERQKGQKKGLRHYRTAHGPMRVPHARDVALEGSHVVLLGGEVDGRHQCGERIMCEAAAANMRGDVGV